MALEMNTKVIDGKEIKYFINENGANIQIVKVEPNDFGDWWAYSTIDVYINIYNDDFTRKASFYVENFNTGITGESWFGDDAYEDCDDYDENIDDATEEDAWERTLDYFSPDDPYDTWKNESDFLNSFNKYCEEYDYNEDLMYDMMVDEESVKECCSDEEGEVCDFEIIKPDFDSEWEGIYQDKECRHLEMPVNIGLNKSGSEREVVKKLLIDLTAPDNSISYYLAYRILDSEVPNEYETRDYYLGECLKDIDGYSQKGGLVSDNCFGGLSSTAWNDESALKLLRFWKLTDIHKEEIQGETYTVFCSGEKRWIVNDEKEDEGDVAYPVLYTNYVEKELSIDLIAEEYNIPVSDVLLMKKAAKGYVGAVYTNCFDEEESSSVRWIKQNYEEWVNELDYTDVIDRLEEEDRDRIYDMTEQSKIEAVIVKLVDNAWTMLFKEYGL